MLELKRPGSAPAFARWAALACAAALAGCQRDAASPSDPSTSSASTMEFSRQISLPDFQGALGSVPVRVKIRLIPGTLIAKKVVIKRDELNKPEKIESQVTDITATGTDGTLTLALGGLQIVFNSSTRFRGEHEDEDRDDPAGSTLDEFVARVNEVLKSGRRPAVEVQRPATPQMPDDPSFVAQVIRLDDAADKPSIEMNITSANLVPNTGDCPGSADKCIEVLKQVIELQVSKGITQLKANLPNTEGELRFEGTVKLVDVDVTPNTAMLADGTILRIVAGTEIEGQSGDEHDGLASLADVKTALAAKQTVLAKGEGLLETATPRTLDVIEVRFKIQQP